MKKHIPLVSIIVNCHNGEKFLKDCLESIKKQTYQNWELIFWDNCSTDNSSKIYRKFKDKRFKYFYASKKTVLYKARNLALSKTKGKIITFIDTDDIWLPNKLKKQVDFFNKNISAEIVYSNIYIQKDFFFFKRKKLKFKHNLPSGKITNCLLKNYFIPWVSIAFKRSILKNKIKLFNEKLDMVADFDLMIMLSLKKKIFSIQQPLAIYRHHPNQLTRENFDLQINHYLDWFKSIQHKKNLINKKNFQNILKKIELFEYINLIKNQKFTLLKLIKIIFTGKIKLSFKLIIIFLFPNFFIKYLMSI